MKKVSIDLHASTAELITERKCGILNKERISVDSSFSPHINHKSSTVCLNVQLILHEESTSEISLVDRVFS